VQPAPHHDAVLLVVLYVQIGHLLMRRPLTRLQLGAGPGIGFQPEVGHFPPGRLDGRDAGDGHEIAVDPAGPVQAEAGHQPSNGGGVEQQGGQYDSTGQGDQQLPLGQLLGQCQGQRQCDAAAQPAPDEDGLVAPAQPRDMGQPLEQPDQRHHGQGARDQDDHGGQRDRAEMLEQLLGADDQADEKEQQRVWRRSPAHPTSGPTSRAPLPRPGWAPGRPAPFRRPRWP
jgi:hypothetical protein